MIQKLKSTDYPRLMQIWESAVLHTHDFLREEDFNYYKENIPTYFQYVELLGYANTEGILVGFMGLSEDNLEMLFIHDDYHGQGIGKKLLNYAVNQKGIKKVDVNEQNQQGVGFYLHCGFKQVARSEKDDQGKDYPILHLAILP
ncbi:GNAT family N-acetyltransferase [Myroides injenensis]|uniref:GNAT family N-acetyltransferase n=1 Tax=Myroides injenensis TaxID=1183151 RepID=UPI00227173B1|nr:GNAT family N-acetyltransferase [Myroides injenensis]